MNHYITPDLRCAFEEGYKEAREKFDEELNKLKEEIKKLEYYDFEFNGAFLTEEVDCHLVLPAEEVYEIIDKHISEMKGVQNDKRI